MRYRDYMRQCLVEFPFCLTGAVCCSVCLTEGFFVPDRLLGRVLPAILPCLLALLFLFLFAFSRRTGVTGAVVSVAVAAVFLLRMLRSDASEASFGLYVLLCIVTTAGLFLLSRTRVGSAMAFAIAGLLLCGNVFMRYGRHPVLLVSGVISIGVLFFLRKSEITMRHYSTLQPRRLGTMLSALILCFSAALLSASAAAILTPQQLPTVRLKLVTELSDLTVLEKMGISSTVHLMDPSQTAWGRNPETMLTSGEGKKEEAQPEPDPEQGGEDVDDMHPQSGGQHRTGDTAPADPIRYHHRKQLLLLPLVLLATAGALVGGKLLSRRRRRERLIQKPGGEQILNMYQYVLRMAKHLNLPVAASETPMEYCERVGTRLDVCLGGRGRLRRLSLIFMRVCYGGQAPTKEEYRFLRDVCDGLPQRLRHQVGIRRYILHFFFRT